MPETSPIVQDQATKFSPISQDPVTGLFGFRLELGNDSSGIRMQARRSVFVTEKAAKVVYDRLCRQRDARHPKPRPSDTIAAPR